jgi:hypothetical protein
MASHGSPVGIAPSLLLMVVDTCPIHLHERIVHRGPNNEGSKPILGLYWFTRDMKRTGPRRP